MFVKPGQRAEADGQVGEFGLFRCPAVQLPQAFFLAEAVQAGRDDGGGLPVGGPGELGVELQGGGIPRRSRVAVRRCSGRRPRQVAGRIEGRDHRPRPPGITSRLTTHSHVNGPAPSPRSHTRRNLTRDSESLGER
jgi:hypothetical protein